MDQELRFKIECKILLDALKSFGEEIPLKMMYEEEMLMVEYQNATNGFKHKMSLRTTKLEVEPEDKKELLSLNNSEKFEQTFKSMFNGQNIKDVQIFASKGKMILQGLLPNNKRLVQAEVLTDEVSGSSLEEEFQIDFQIKTKDLLYAFEKLNS